ncbi:MAG: GDCCVxC domain-containing (seleno)protein [Flavobacteriales bacterium]
MKDSCHLNILYLFMGVFCISCSAKKPEKNTAPIPSVQNELLSEITCPECGYKKTLTMPTETCLIKYTCEKCKTVLYPKDKDCCVFCSYGSKKCPSEQNN